MEFRGVLFRSSVRENNPGVEIRSPTRLLRAHSSKRTSGTASRRPPQVSAQMSVRSGKTSQKKSFCFREPHRIALLGQDVFYEKGLNSRVGISRGQPVFRIDTRSYLREQRPQKRGRREG